ncbi:LysM domain-containing protein [Xylophilus sp. GW821-FHT01B05]
MTRSAAVALAAAALCGSLPALAQTYPITPAQRATAQQVAQAGVPVSELAPDAPDTYVVKRGDTLWAISGLYLRQPWRWPELWGMNLEQVRNPHLIYPGQTLYLERIDGMARLRTTRPGSTEPETLRISPRTRSESLASNVIPTLQPQFIEPFLAEPLVLEEGVLEAAPRLVGTFGDHVMLARGDRAYARGSASQPLQLGEGQPRDFRVFREAVPLKDPASGEILGYEAQYVGRARLLKGESVQTVLEDGKELTEIVPASMDITGSKEEMRAGDRLQPEPPRQLVNYTPHAPQQAFENGRVVSIYGSAVANAAQNQIVAINKGTRDGMEVGHVLAILTEGDRIVDPTDDKRTRIKLPDERNGLLMVFRTFDRVSYGLILQIRTGVKVGDHLVSPQ